MSQSAISVNQVTVTYRNGYTALRAATFQVPGGSIAALVGVNGSGKSTLFKALMGFVRGAGRNFHSAAAGQQGAKTESDLLRSPVGRGGLVISGAGGRRGDDGTLRPYGLAASANRTRPSMRGCGAGAGRYAGIPPSADRRTLRRAEKRVFLARAIAGMDRSFCWMNRSPA